MSCYVRHTDGQRHAYSTQKEYSTSGPFMNDAAAERFMVALANSGKCHEAKVIQEDVILEEERLDKKSKILKIDLAVSRDQLRAFTEDQIRTMFEMLSTVEITNVYYNRACDNYTAAKKNNASGRSQGHLADVMNEAFTSCQKSRDAYLNYVGSIL